MVLEEYRQISLAVKQALDQAQNILLLCHAKPDGDSLGAILALANYLTSRNKQVISFCYDPLPANFQFLPNHQLLTDSHLVFSQKYDVVVILDCGNFYLTKAEDLLAVLPDHLTINIDHHASNPGYGDLNLVLPTASSTTEILYRLLKDWHVPINQEVATCLLAGLLTDTGGFINAATNYLSLEASADLIKSGANLSQLAQLTLASQNINTLKLWGLAFNRLQNNPKYDLVYTFITRQDFADCGLTGDSTDGLANFLHIIKGAKIILVLTEQENNKIKGSMRTTANDVDLNKLAQSLGGGGHRKAAGFTLSGHLEYVNNKLTII